MIISDQKKTKQANTMSHKLLLSYQNHHIDYNTVSELLTKIWTSLEENNVSITNIKVIYSISTECLENSYKHAELTCPDCLVNFKLFLSEDEAEIIVSNPINTLKVQPIQERITFLKSLNPVGLKKLYQYEIKKREISNKGGAGLGLIIITRKSDGNINCNVENKANNISMIEISVKVPLNS